MKVVVVVADLQAEYENDDADDDAVVADMVLVTMIALRNVLYLNLMTLTTNCLAFYCAHEVLDFGQAVNSGYYLLNSHIVFLVIVAIVLARVVVAEVNHWHWNK